MSEDGNILPESIQPSAVSRQNFSMKLGWLTPDG
jgi:hypothetical protein